MTHIENLTRGHGAEGRIMSEPANLVRLLQKLDESIANASQKAALLEEKIGPFLTPPPETGRIVAQIIEPLPTTPVQEYVCELIRNIGGVSVHLFDLANRFDP